MFNINFDSPSTEFGMMLVVAVSVAITLKSLIERSRWGKRLFGYLDLADRLSREGASEKELEAAQAIRDHVADRAVDGIRREREVKGDVLDAISAFTFTICCALVYLAIKINAALFPELSDYLDPMAQLLLMVGVVIDAVRAALGYYRFNRPRKESREKELGQNVVPKQDNREHDEEPDYE